jgi:hypothetical protein
VLKAQGNCAVCKRSYVPWLCPPSQADASLPEAHVRTTKESSDLHFLCVGVHVCVVLCVLCCVVLCWSKRYWGKRNIPQETLLPPNFLFISRTGFFKHCTFNVATEYSFVVRICAFRICSSIPGLYPLDATTISHPIMSIKKMSADITKYPGGWEGMPEQNCSHWEMLL